MSDFQATVVEIASTLLAESNPKAQESALSLLRTFAKFAGKRLVPDGKAFLEGIVLKFGVVSQQKIRDSVTEVFAVGIEHCAKHKEIVEILGSLLDKLVAPQPGIREEG